MHETDLKPCYALLFNPGNARDGRAIRDEWEKVYISSAAKGGLENMYMADVDGDGNVDIIGSEGNEEKKPGRHGGIRVIFGPPRNEVRDPARWQDGGLFPATFDTGLFVWTEARDVNRDGRLDIVIGGRKYLNGKFGGIQWLEAPDGDRRDLAAWKAHMIDPGFDGHGLRWADIDGDGDEDLFDNNADWDTPQDRQETSWYANPGPASGAALRQPWPKTVLHRSPEYLAKVQGSIGDLDGNGTIDLVMPRKDAVIEWFSSNGAKPSAFDRIDIRKPPRTVAFQRPLHMLDVNGDGRQDLLGAIFQDNDGHTPPDVWSVFWLEWTGKTPTADGWVAHPIKRAYGTDYKNKWFGEKYDFVRFTDVDRDGDLDIVANIEELRIRSTMEQSILGMVWFENAGVRQVAHDDFSAGLGGGTGWAAAWEASPRAAVVRAAEDGGGSQVSLQGEASITRLLEKPLDHGMLDFGWFVQGFEDPDRLLIEVRDAATKDWVVAQSMLNGQDNDVAHNETLSLARFGPVDGVRFRLQADAEDDGARVDDIVLRARTDQKRYDLKPPLAP